MGSYWSQYFPGRPNFTEKDVPDLKGKVYLVTGSNTGIGKELAQLLYSKNAKVYIAARSSTKANAAINAIKVAQPASTGSLIYLHLDLADLSTIKASVAEFLSKENKLHVLFNNAGIQVPPVGTKTAQGYEAQLGVNCVGPFLFTKLLTPILVETAKNEPQDTVRVIWVSSLGAEQASFKPGGVDMDDLDNRNGKVDLLHQYGRTKAGNYYQGTEFAKRVKDRGVISIPLNPGNCNSDLGRNYSWLFATLVRPLLHPPLHGAYTELFAGVSKDVTLERSGAWVVPWGRIQPIRGDLVEGSKSKADGGTGIAERFWEWNEEQVKPFL